MVWSKARRLTEKAPFCRSTLLGNLLWWMKTSRAGHVVSAEVDGHSRRLLYGGQRDIAPMVSQLRPALNFQICSCVCASARATFRPCSQPRDTDSSSPLRVALEAEA